MSQTLIDTEDANGNRTSYNYDGMGRVHQIQYPSISTPHVSNAGNYEEFGYDADSNVSSLRTRSDLHAVVNGWDALSNGFDIAYGRGDYDSGGSTITDNNGRSIGEGEVTPGISPPVGAGAFSFDPPTLEQLEAGQC